MMVGGRRTSPALDMKSMVVKHTNECMRRALLVVMCSSLLSRDKQACSFALLDRGLLCASFQEHSQIPVLGHSSFFLVARCHR